MLLNEIRYQDPRTKTYLGSPSIVRLDDGDLLATHDYFGPGSPKDPGGDEHLTSVYRSSDGGRTWCNLTHIAGAFWSGLFVLGGDVYLLGTSRHYGAVVIRRSSDGGYTWTHPLDAHSGLLFPGGVLKEAPNYHCAPVPIVVRDGRLYRAFEDCDPCIWGVGFKALVISVDVGADLLDASSWRMSNKLAYDPAWSPSSWGKLDAPGWLEGNVVADPEGQLWDVLRFNSSPLGNRAAMVRIEDEGRRLTFDPETGFIVLPGGHTKVTIRRDPETCAYVTLSNDTTDGALSTARNRLALCVSEDLVNWRRVTTLLRDDSGMTEDVSARQVGFQYVDWQFDGDDLIYIVRTAYDGAHNYHDANRVTFHRLESFRPLLSEDAR